MSVQDNPSMDRTYRLDLIVSIKEAQLVQDHVNGRSGGTSKARRAPCYMSRQRTGFRSDVSQTASSDPTLVKCHGVVFHRRLRDEHKLDNAMIHRRSLNVLHIQT
jgi:hypothetical protein